MLRPSERGPRRVGFVGTFEVANYGDCLFPVVYMELIRKRLPDEAFAFSFYSPLAGTCPLADYGPVQRLPDRLDRLQFDSDQLILCGGETLSIGHSSGTYNFPASTLSAYARMWLGPVVAAARGDVDFFVHCVGMPTTDLETKTTIANLLGYANRVSIRDRVSAERLQSRFPVEVDPVFALSTCRPADWWETHAKRFLPQAFQPGRYLSVQISAPYVKGSLVPWCEQVALIAQEQDMPVLLLPICHFLGDGNTGETARDILVGLGVPPERIAFPATGSEDVLATAALLGCSGGLVTSSLHALVTAVSFGVPFAGYVGEGSANSKHRQTLLTAGVDFGIAPTMSAISDVFRAAKAQDLEGARNTAIKSALRDFDGLMEAMAAPSSSRSPIPDAAITEAMTLDLLPTRSFKFEVKRFILRLSKRAAPLGWLLETMRKLRFRREASA